ncbi:MAG: ATP-binding protein [Gammaproteobacteria bacterium]
MKFYDRIAELKQLDVLDLQAQKTGIMTVLTGRRRVGKTMLALHHVKDKKFLYLFVGRKEEYLLCQEFQEEITKHFQIPVFGEIRYFKEIFALLIEIAKKEKFTIIFDEFQEFFQINPSVYFDIQKLWDLNRYNIKLHVIFIGSVYSLMHKIFEDQKQPLFGRADRIIKVAPFSLKTTSKILKDNKIFTPDNFFNIYVITGNMPKYLDLIIK